MDRRFFICLVIGSGTLGDPYRPDVLGVSHQEVAEFPTDEAGYPTVSEVVVSVPADEGDLVSGVEITPDDPRIPEHWR